MIDSLDCCHHFLLVEGVWHHLSLVAKTQYTTPPWCHGEAGVRLQSPSSPPLNPLHYRRRTIVRARWPVRPLIMLVRPHIRRIECNRLLSTTCNWLVKYFAIYTRTVWGVHGEMLQYIAPLSHAW